MTSPDISHYLHTLRLPPAESHKGQNGKVMIIGGSELFHAASRWSLDVASKFVDMVFYASVPSTNELIKEAKGAFWNGIVIDRAEIENYITEANAILIGPGMTRSPETAEISNRLLQMHPDKNWVIDAGALQMLESSLLTGSCIITPHQGEFRHLLGQETIADDRLAQLARTYSKDHHNVCIVLKGHQDLIVKGDQVITVDGGNGGMTKGGTGDVLAGLIAGLYATNDQLTSAVTGSYVNKVAGDYLYESVGPNFNSSDLVAAIPKVLWQAIKP